MSLKNKIGKGLLGSLRRQAQFEVRRHQKTNPALRKARRSLGVRFLQSLLGTRSFVCILTLYAALVILLLIWDGTSGFLASWSSWTLAIPRAVTGYFLAAQVTAIGLLFPIAVALVTLIIQREEASSTSSDVQVYYSESSAYRIGASGIALSVVLAAHLLWPQSVHASTGGLPPVSYARSVESVVVILHLLWLGTNLAALWHFFVTSLSFIRPAERAMLRRQYAASIAIPRELSDMIVHALYVSLNSVDWEPSTTGRTPTIHFGAIFNFTNRGEPEVLAPNVGSKELHDVWLTPLSWAVSRWWERSQRYTAQHQSNATAGSLTFLSDPGVPLRASGILCQREGGVPMTLFERLLVKISFRFRSR